MQNVRIYFGGDIANLYEVGYLSTDLYQLIAFSELINQERDEDIQRWFGEKARPFNRYASILEKYRRTSEIREVRGGSLEITIAVASLISSIVVPLVSAYIQKHSGAPLTPVSFEISVGDARLQHLLSMFSDGQFGSGPQAIEKLFEELRGRGYNVSLRAADAYAIHETLERYSQRMVRTIQRP